jgi:hypothetical protein
LNAVLAQVAKLSSIKLTNGAMTFLQNAFSPKIYDPPSTILPTFLT